MIKLTKEDIKFKKATKYPGSDKLLVAAVALETVEHVRTKYGQDVAYDQKSIIALLLSIIGWDTNRVKTKDEFSLWKDRVIFSEYILKLTNMLSEYLFNRISEFDKQKKTTEEISDWLRRMAK